VKYELGFISQKSEFFKVAAVKTSKLMADITLSLTIECHDNPSRNACDVTRKQTMKRSEANWAPFHLLSAHAPKNFIYLKAQMNAYRASDVPGNVQNVLHWLTDV
jgi:hypothetical protein